MPIIYTYPSVTPASGDYLLISDVSETTPANATRKCTVQDIVNLVGALVPGGGTVTSVGLQAGTTGLTIGDTGANPITTTGTFTIGGTLVVANGGTGSAGPLTGVIHGNGAGAFTASNVNLTSEVSHVLPEANGGTGESTYTKGDILYCDSTGANLTKLAIGGTDQILSIASDIPKWVTASTIAVTSVNVAGGSTGLTFSGGPITSTGTITMAGTLAVANGGTGATTLTDGGILLGSATSAVTATAQPTNGQLLIGSTAGDPVLSQLTAGANITINNTAGGIEIVGAASGGNGIYGGSGSLSGDTTITSGANDLTFTATTGDVIFNNTITPNPSMIIDGATNSIGIGGSFVTTDQLSVSNSTSTNTTAIGVYATNTSGTQKGMDIEISGGATTNTALKLIAEGAGTNYNLVTFGPGNSGFGTTSPVASAKVEVNSTTQGFLPPVMTTAQKNAISTPAEGLIVYDITLHKLCVRVAAAWETITSA